MKVIVDDKIPYIKGALEPYAEVVYLAGNLTTAEVVKDADVLVTRTRTMCNKAVLDGSKVKLIATATIGFDHIDTQYCKAAGIEWVNAPGCNAESVNQYISAALLSIARRDHLDLAGKTIGIVGVGQVGSRIAKTCEILGMKVLLNDPPRERAEGSARFVPIDVIQAQADIISFHVPLNRQGIDKTCHMVDEKFLAGLSGRPLIINTCRGEVFSSGDVREARQLNILSGMVIDCWENEPDIDLDLLKLADYATPHIAGYSKDGKANGTKNSVRAISRYFGLGIDDWEPPGVDAPAQPVITVDGKHRSRQSILTEVVLATYPIQSDDEMLRKHTHLFEQLRGDYPVRREFDSYSVRASHTDADALDDLERLGFNLIT